MKHLKIKIKNYKLKTNPGFSLAEIIIAVAIFMIFSGGLAVLAVGSYLNNLEDSKNTQVNAVLTETWEALRAIRNNNWADVSNGAHGLRSSSGYWEFFGASDEILGITRAVTVADVQRDASGNIVSSGGEVDSDTKLITIDLSWVPAETQNRSLQLSSYLTNYLAPNPWPPAPPEEP